MGRRQQSFQMLIFVEGNVSRMVKVILLPGLSFLEGRVGRVNVSCLFSELA